MIQAGYQLHVTTWENDADHYQTNSIGGLSKEDVEFYVHILRHFKSKYNGGGEGNDEICTSTLLSIVKESLDEHPGISADVRSKYYHEFGEADEDTDEETTRAKEIYDELREVLGDTVDYEDYDLFIRVVEKMEVTFIKCDSIDMSHKFNLEM
jgi:hypothetical protein